MTALLLGSTSSGPTVSNTVRPAPSRRRPAGHPTSRPSDPRAHAWAAPAACSPGDREARTAVSAAGARLYWTPRGLVVLVLAVALVAAVMATTVVLAFLAISDAPPATPTGSALSAVGPQPPGRA